MRLRGFGSGAGWFALALCFLQLLGCAGATLPTRQFVTGAAGTEIAYETHGSGRVALVFVHGWSCDRSYWRDQLADFSERYRVIAIDLGGHGESPAARDDWSIRSFGLDVAAVVAEIDAEAIVLIGHSMGGPVVLEAATQVGDRVVGVVGVDTLKRVGAEPVALQDAERAFNTSAEEFPAQTAAFVRSAFFVQNSPAELIDEVAADMGDGDARVAAASGASLLTYDVRATLGELQGTPLLLINSDFTPTDEAALKAVHPDSRVAEMSNVGHFVMLERPAEFNAILQRELDRIVRGK